MRSRLRSPGDGVRSVAALRAAAVTVLMAAAALSALGAPVAAVAAEPPHACPPRSPATVNEGAPSRLLLSRLAVLRRPQTAEDQLPAAPGLSGLPPVGEGVYVKYIRHATSLGGTGYYLVPVQRATRAIGCPEAEEVMLVTVEPGGFRSFSGVTARGLMEGKDVGTRWLSGHSAVYGIVPDGVARVTIRYKTPGRHGHVDVSARPVNNVFAVAVPATIGRSALPVVPSTVLWHSRKGRVIKTIHTGG